MTKAYFAIILMSRPPLNKKSNRRADHLPRFGFSARRKGNAHRANKFPRQAKSLAKRAFFFGATAAPLSPSFHEG